MTKTRGIIDPWNLAVPLRPVTPVPRREGKRDLDDIDFDADLAIPGRYIIRSAHASFDVTSIKVTTPGDALNVLVDCVLDLWTVKAVAKMLQAAGIGARRGDRMYEAPDEDVAASTLDNGEAIIWFVQKSLDKGMLILAKILRAPEAAAVTRKHGIIPMLNA